MKKMTYCFLLLLLCMAVFSGCGQKMEKPETQDSPSKEEPVQVEQPKVLLQSQDGSCEMTAPNDWRTSTGGIVKGAKLEVANASKSAFAVVLEEKGGANSLNLSDYADRVVKKMSGSSELLDAQTIATSSAIVDNMKGIQTQLTGTVDGVRIHYWIYCLVHNSDFYQLTGWCLDRDTQTFQSILPPILESFQLNSIKSGASGKESSQ